MKTLALALVGALFLAGCASDAPVRSRSRSKVQAPLPDDEANFKAALEELKARKVDLVVPRAHNDCIALNKLADQICDASDNLCIIADRHGGDPVYVQPCRASEKDCESAQKDGDRCVREW